MSIFTISHFLKIPIFVIGSLSDISNLENILKVNIQLSVLFVFFVLSFFFHISDFLQIKEEQTEKKEYKKNYIKNLSELKKMNQKYLQCQKLKMEKEIELLFMEKIKKSLKRGKGIARIYREYKDSYYDLMINDYELNEKNN